MIEFLTFNTGHKKLEECELDPDIMDVMRDLIAKDSGTLLNLPVSYRFAVCNGYAMLTLINGEGNVATITVIVPEGGNYSDADSMLEWFAQKNGITGADRSFGYGALIETLVLPGFDEFPMNIVMMTAEIEKCFGVTWIKDH